MKHVTQLLPVTPTQILARTWPTKWHCLVSLMSQKHTARAILHLAKHDWSKWWHEKFGMHDLLS